MGHEATVAMMQSLFPASIYSRIRRHSMRYHRWAASAARAEHFLRTVFPFLVAKSAEAQLALDFRAWHLARASFVGSDPVAERSEADRFRSRLRALRTTSAGQTLREAAQ